MTAPAGKSKAIIAYLTFVVLLIAFFMNRDQKHAFATWHIKNMFGLVLLLFVSVFLSYNESLYQLGRILYFLSIGLWLFSLIMAATNQQKAIPWLSEKFQGWFTFLD